MTGVDNGRNLLTMLKSNNTKPFQVNCNQPFLPSYQNVRSIATIIPGSHSPCKSMASVNVDCCVIYIAILNIDSIAKNP